MQSKVIGKKTPGAGKVAEKTHTHTTHDSPCFPEMTGGYSSNK